MGNLYAFTQDGLFVAQLFQDVRQGPLWEMPVALRNMRVGGLSLHDENFFPSVAQTSEGQVYLNSGGMNIVRVDKLDTIRNIPPSTIQVTATSLKEAKDYVVASEAARQAAQGSGVLAVAILTTAPAVDQSLERLEKCSMGTDRSSRSGRMVQFADEALNVNGGPYWCPVKGLPPRGRRAIRILSRMQATSRTRFKSGSALDLMMESSGGRPNRPSPVAGASSY